MHIVAIATLSGPLETEAPWLASTAGLTVVDVYGRVGGVLPRPLLFTPDEAKAHAVFEALRARGYGVLLCDSRSILPTTSMVDVKRPVLVGGGLGRAPGDPAALPFDDVAALLLLGVRAAVERTTFEKDISWDVGRGPNVVEVDVTRIERVEERALVLVRRSGDTPWILHENEVQYVGLGFPLKPTRRENFDGLVALLATRCPRALVDDRFVGAPPLHRSPVRVRDHDRAHVPKTDSPLDLAVHLLTLWLVGSAASPYRTMGR